MRTQHSLGLGLALLTALSVTAFNTHHESGETSVSIDPKLAAKVFDGQKDIASPLADLLRSTLTVQNDGESIAFVLYAFVVRKGKTISEFTSRSFTPPTGRPWLLPSEYLPGDQFLGERRVSPDGLTTTKKAVPVDVGVEEPGKFIVNGVFADKPAGWETMEAVYFIIAPIKSTKEGAMTYPAAVFAMTVPVVD